MHPPPSPSAPFKGHSMLSQIIDRYCRVLRMVMVAFLALMFVLVAGNVVLRYGFNSGVTVSEELSRWLFVWVVFLGAIVAQRDGAHLGTDALLARLSPAGKRLCFVISHLLMLLVCWMLARGSWDQVLVNRETSSPVMGVSGHLLRQWTGTCAVSRTGPGKPAVAALFGTDQGGRADRNPRVGRRHRLACPREVNPITHT